MPRRGDGIYLRGKTFWLDFTHKSERHITRLGKNISRTVAGELARVQRAAVLKGEAGIGAKPKRKDPTFEEATRAFLTWSEATHKPRTHRGYGYFLVQLEASFAHRHLSQIDPLSVERHRHARIKAGARVSANRELQLLGALFTQCRALKLSDIPTPEIKLTKEPRTRVRYLTDDEEARLLAQTTEPLRTIILVGIHTGLRLTSEVLTLRKEHVDLAHRLVTVEGAYAKNGKLRTVPLNSVIRVALARILETMPGPYVFAKPDGRPYTTVLKAFTAACRDAKLNGVTPHTCRHTFATRLTMAGVDARTIQELGGWSSLAMVERYSHLSQPHKAEAVERIAKNSTTLFTTVAPAGSGDRVANAL